MQKIIQILKDLSISKRLAISISFLIGLISLFIFIYFPKQVEKNALMYLRDKALITTNIFASNVNVPLFFNDSLTSVEELKNAKMAKDIVFVIVTNDKNKVFACYFKDSTNVIDFNTLDTTTRISTDKTRFFHSKQLLRDNKKIGTLYTSFTLGYMNYNVLRTKKVITLISLLIFFTGISIVLLISKLISKPFKEMGKTFDLIADGDLSLRVEQNQNNEIGMLARSFNKMVHNLENAYQDLENLNENLENRVLERTQALEHEINERKKAENKIRESEEIYRIVTEQTGQLIYDYNVFTGKIQWSGAILEITGFEKEEFFVNDINSWELMIHHDDRKKLFSVIEKRILNNHRLSVEYRLQKKDKSYIYIKDEAVCLQDLKGRNYRVLGTIQDITTRIKNQEATIRNNKLLKGVADASFTLLVNTSFNNAMSQTLQVLGETVDVNRVYIFRNHSLLNSNKIYFSQRFEWTNGKNTIQIDDPSYQNIDYEEVAPNWFRTLSSEQIVTGLTKEFISTEKEFLENRDVKSVILIPIVINEEFWGFVGFDDCVSDKIWTENEEAVLRLATASIGGAIQREITNVQLIDAKESAEDSSRMKTVLMTNLSHEFRTPLQGIFGNAERLKDEFHNELIDEMTNEILISGNRLLATISSIMDLMELESGDSQVKYDEINLSKEIQSVADSFQLLIQRKNLYLYVDIKNELTINSDKAYVQQILKNLIDNAIKFTPKGGVLIEAEAINGNNEKVKITVTDTGIGISEDKYELIFKEFRQASEGFGRQFEGSGLGLTIIKKMIQLLEGEITFVSELGVGSSFSVILPVNKTVQKTQAIPLKYHSQIEEKVEIPAGRKRLVLLVEDNPINREITVAFLKEYCNVETCVDPMKTVNLVKQKQFDAILMDINLGGEIDGLKLAQDIRLIPEYEQIPIVALTGYTRNKEREILLNGGCSHYLAKPFNRNSILALIKDILY